MLNPHMCGCLGATGICWNNLQRCLISQQRSMVVVVGFAFPKHPNAAATWYQVLPLLSQETAYVLLAWKARKAQQSRREPERKRETKLPSPPVFFSSLSGQSPSQTSGEGTWLTFYQMKISVVWNSDWHCDRIMSPILLSRVTGYVVVFSMPGKMY